MPKDKREEAPEETQSTEHALSMFEQYMVHVVVGQEPFKQPSQMRYAVNVLDRLDFDPDSLIKEVQTRKNERDEDVDLQIAYTVNELVELDSPVTITLSPAEAKFVADEFSGFFECRIPGIDVQVSIVHQSFLDSQCN